MNSARSVPVWCALLSALGIGACDRSARHVDVISEHRPTRHPRTPRESEEELETPEPNPAANRTEPSPTSQPTAASSRPVKPEPYWLADPATRARFLNTRIHTGQMLGTFNGMCSMWYAVFDVLVSCKTEVICEIPLRSPFPEFYQPTWNEYFNAVARQAHARWSYLDDKYGFMFNEPPLPLPFEVQVADGWRAEHRGQYVAFIPTQAAVGMDIYMLGTYSADENEAELHRRVRKHWALQFASRFDNDITTAEMQIVTIGGTEALFYDTAHPQTKVLWRQWAFVSNRMCFVIVSAIDPALDEAIWPDVEVMQESFRAKIQEGG